MKILRPKNQKAGINWPGSIAYATEAGNFPGCVAIPFEGSLFNMTQAINDFFSQEENGDLLVVEMVVVSPKSIIVIAGKTLTQEEMQAQSEFANEVEALMEKRREQRAADRAAHAIKLETYEREQAELAKLGKTCKEHHAPLVEEVRKTRKLLKKAGVDPESLKLLPSVPEGEEDK